MPRRQAPVKLKVASLKTLSDATFEILGQFFRRVVSILAPNGVKKIAELGNSLRRLHLPREYKQYSEFDKQRLLVVPGCTGLWQVSGRNGLSFDQMVNLDLQYITHRSIIGDIEIMLRTFRIFVIPNQAY